LGSSRASLHCASPGASPLLYVCGVLAGRLRSVARTRSPVDAGEDRAAVAEASSARFEPRIERAHWAGLGVRAQGDADEVPVAGLVGLRASDAQQESIVATGEILRRQF